MKKKILLSLTAAFTCALLAGCGVTTLDPEDFCSVDVNGANGYGMASLNVDYDDLKDDVVDCLGNDSTRKTRQKAESFVDGIEFKIVSDNAEKLSNGDVVEVEVDYNEDNAKKNYKFKFKSKTIKHKVADLDEAETIDPFEGLTIKYEGFSPNGRYTIDNSGCSDTVKNFFSYDYSNNPERVANGDTITIKAVCANDERLLSEGYVMESDTKEFTVSGLEEGTQLDPFADIKVEYTGISPAITASVDTSACDDYIRNNVAYYIENNGAIAKGENVVITAEYDEYKAEQNGYVFTEKEKTFTADNAAVFLDSLDSTDLSAIDRDFFDLATTTIASNGYYEGSPNMDTYNATGDSGYCNYTVEKIDIVPVKKLLLTPKNLKEASTKSLYAMIYRVDGEYYKTEDGGIWCDCDIPLKETVSASFYVACEVRDLGVNPDGTLNTDMKRDMKCLTYWQKDYNFNLQVETICENFRTKNAADYYVIIVDTEDTDDTNDTDDDEDTADAEDTSNAEDKE